MFIGIEIGGTKLQLVAGDESGMIAERRRFAVERVAGGEAIRAQIAEALPGLLAKWRPTAVGVGYGGPVDWRTGRVKCSHQVAGWSDFPLGEWLRERAGVPVFVDNDANVGALGEALHGAGRGASPVFWVNSGTGVGGGLVVDGRLYHGATPGEMEIGHLRFERDGEIRIVEDHCSGAILDVVVREFTDIVPDAVISQMVKSAPPGCESRHIAPALAQGCELAEQLLMGTARDMAFVLSHVVHLLHPEVIVVGGGLSLIGEPLRERVARDLSKHIMEAFLPGPRVVLAELKEDAVPVGALALAARGH